ncbi:MAG: WXG100 family type VII secretion target [Promicromonosporaceae bacterium]|nr:WXG100 family type VII secretion target [Promicromonosporaceae bacterium]
MRYDVDSERVAQASAAVSGSAGAIRGEVAGMVRHLEDLQASWHGGAATAFGGVMTQWRGAQTQVEQALDAIQTALASAARTYADAESQAARLFATH